MPKLIILSEATESVCAVGPFRSREISRTSASWFVASVWCAYSLDKLKDWANKPQRPGAPDPSILLTNLELWAVGESPHFSGALSCSGTWEKASSEILGPLGDIF